MLRLTSSAVILGALGVSAVVHAAVLLAPVGHFGHARAAGDDAIALELVLEPALPEPVPAVAPVEARATIWPGHTHPYPVPPSHDSTRHDPNLVHVAPTVAAPAPAPAPPADTTPDETPRFAITIGATTGDSFGKVSPTGIAAPRRQDGAEALAERDVDTPARLVRGVAPSYPAPARAEGLEGDVRVELVVGVSGAVESARVVRSVGHGLDEAALQAVRQFRFAPAVEDGHPARVRMGWSIQFRLQ